MATTIRSAGVGDVAAVLALWRDADAEPTHTDDAPSLVRLLEHDPGAGRGRIDGTVVGSVIVAWDGWRGSALPSRGGDGSPSRGSRSTPGGRGEKRLAEAGALRLQAIVVETDPRATGFWRATAWEEQVARLRFVKG